MQAITTKVLPATNTQPTRVKATAQAGSITLIWNNYVGHDANHIAAARALAAKLGWAGQWLGGYDHAGNGVFVCAIESCAMAFRVDGER